MILSAWAIFIVVTSGAWGGDSFFIVGIESADLLSFDVSMILAHSFLVTGVGLGGCCGYSSGSLLDY